MSLNESISDEVSEIHPFKCCCERERSETSITIDSMTKWISSLEDTLNTATTKTDQTLSLILARLDHQALLEAKNAELIRCNRVLAEELSKKLYSAEFKQKKILNPAAEEIVQGGLHPKVIPYVYLDKQR